MTVSPQENQPIDQKPSHQEQQELNWKKLHAKYERELEQERQRSLQLERNLQEERERKNAKRIEEEDEEDDEPYVDRRKLEKKLAKFGEKTKQETQSDIQREVQKALDEERKRNWLKQNPDFYDVLQHADKFAQLDEELADTILDMPDGFSRQKLVYKNIKALGLHKPPEEKKSSIQDRVDANKRSPAYQPTGVGSAPYGVYTTGGKDYSKAEQKNAYENVMKRLQSTTRLG